MKKRLVLSAFLGLLLCFALFSPTASAEAAPTATDLSTMNRVEATLLAARALSEMCPRIITCTALLSPQRPCTSIIITVLL